MTIHYLPVELSFLKPQVEESLLGGFDLLKSKYDAKAWEIEGLCEPVNFEIVLDDNSKLSDRKNSLLRNQIKGWIAIQASGHIKLGGATKTQKLKRIRIVLAITDFLLTSQYAPRIRQYGLSTINEQIIRTLLIQITENRDTTSRFYDWPNKLEQYIKHELLENKQFSLAGNHIALTDAQCEAAKALILKQSGQSLKTAILAPAKVYKHVVQKIYSNTLLGKRKYIIPERFCFSSDLDSNFKPQMKIAPVRSKHEKTIKQIYSLHTSCLESLSHLEKLNFQAPDPSTFECLKEFSAKFFNLPEPDIYRSIPVHVGLKAFRRSVKYILSYGSDLLLACTNVYQAARLENLSLTNYVKKNGVKHLLPATLSSLGCTTWSKTIKQDAQPEDFGRLGLHDYLQIFFGSAQIIFGALSARRQEELMKCTPSEVSSDTQMLGFYVGKSGLGDTREYTERPIPGLCIRISNLISEFHRRIYQNDEARHGLFAIPSHRAASLGSANHSSYNKALNIACDYFQIYCEKTHQKYNLRQHQLRRLFAQAFYWSAFGDLDVLRWFLAHTDKAHVYRYITEHVPGAVLTTIKAEFTAEFLSRGNKTFSDLEKAIVDHFGTASFSVLDREEFESYLAHLINTCKVTIEPDFFEGRSGEPVKFKFEVLYV
ncbi:hypothetical protein [Pseudomonas sp. Z13]|uniref:hypothetical protein n=1 Tax=Pseudomonas sp. Z13 TaxID=2983409 RepID=UPI002E82319E|nr:hypothetical protein [Pseudomonas sp. Z13]